MLVFAVNLSVQAFLPFVSCLGAESPALTPVGLSPPPLSAPSASEDETTGSAAQISPIAVTSAERTTTPPLVSHKPEAISTTPKPPSVAATQPLSTEIGSPTASVGEAAAVSPTISPFAQSTVPRSKSGTTEEEVSFYLNSGR